LPRAAMAPIFDGGRTVRFVERVYPDPEPGEIRIAVEANAICWTDRAIFEEGSRVVAGHEVAGIVEQTGAGATVEVGTRGVVFLMDFCGSCRSCRRGFTNQCEAKRRDTGFDADGGYGPFALVHETNFFPVPKNLDAPSATLLLDVMGTGGHALERLSQVRSDVESLLVCGAGPIGLGVLAMAKIRLGADTPVYVTDLFTQRLELAESLGGIVASPHDIRGYDAAIDTSGKQVAREQGLAALSKRGALVCVGHGEGLALNVSEDLIAPERSVLGSEYFRFDELPGNLDLLLNSGDVFRQVITGTVPVSEIQAGLERFFAGAPGKIIVTQGAL